MPKRSRRPRRPPTAAEQQPPDWSKFGKVFADIAYDALGSEILAGVVGASVAIIAQHLAADLGATFARVARAPTAAPMPPPPSPDDDAHVVDEEADEAATADEPAPPPPETPPVSVDPKVAEAAETLGVGVNATEDEIRAALRKALSSSSVHPDHGGDGDEAKKLIAAKNCLIERARKARA